MSPLFFRIATKILNFNDTRPVILQGDDVFGLKACILISLSSLVTHQLQSQSLLCWNTVVRENKCASILGYCVQGKWIIIVSCFVARNTLGAWTKNLTTFLTTQNFCHIKFFPFTKWRKSDETKTGKVVLEDTLREIKGREISCHKNQQHLRTHEFFARH